MIVYNGVNIPKMGTQVPDPPLFAQALSVFLILCLVFLLFYSFRLRQLILHPQAKAPVLPLAPEKPTQTQPLQKRTDYLIEPSPIPGQRIPFPLLSEGAPELDLSVVIPVRNPGKGIVQVLTRFVDHFSQRQKFSFEIVLVDICSHDSTRADCIAFAKNHKEVRVLHIPSKVRMNVAVATGIARTRGRLVYVFNVSDGVLIEDYEAYEAKINPFSDGMALVCGNWKDSDEDPLVLRSTLNICLEWLSNYIMGFAIKERQCKHALTFLMTRKFVAVLAATLRLQTERYDMETLVIAAKTGTRIKTVKLKAKDPRKHKLDSLDRTDDVICASQVVFMYYTGLWKVRSFRLV